MSLPVLRLPKRVHPRMPKALPLVEQYPLYALSFDGVDDYVLVADSPSLRITDKITVEAVVYPFDVSSWHAFLTGKAFTYFLAVFGTLIRWYLGDGVNWFLTEATVSLSANAWTHIAATYDSSTGAYQVFKNGALAKSSSVTPKSIGLNDKGVSIGRCYPPTPAYYPFSGLIASARIYNRVLSRGEVWRNSRNPLNPVRDGLVLWLPMVEGIGTSVRDYSGYGNNGTIYGAVWRDLAKYEVHPP